MRALVRSEVPVAAPAGQVWSYLTDWSRQGEWIPLTRVEELDSADRVGGRLRAWTGVGPVGFWDPMTITAWEQSVDGSARCEVLHTGRVLAGEGEFAVTARDAGSCTFVWWERLVVPGGPAGAVAWRLAAPAVQRSVDRALRTMARRVEGGA
jgi:uncharacterized protein YndB with AHSA1/START domain